MIDLIFKITTIEIIDYVFGILFAIAALYIGLMYFKYSLKVVLGTMGVIVLIALTHIFDLTFFRTIIYVIAFTAIILLLLNIVANHSK